MGRVLYKNGKNRENPGIAHENISIRSGIKSYTRFSLDVFSIFPSIGALFPKTDDGFTLARNVFRGFLTNGQYFVLQCIYQSKAKLKAHLIRLVVGGNQ